MGKFPHYTQLDQMDCGPTCLQMIAKHYGRSYTIGALRKKSFITREGVSLLGISDAAEAIGFRTLGVKINYHQLLTEAPLPSVVHWYQRHFIVVYKITNDKVFVADPSSGLLTYSKNDFLKGWFSTIDSGQDAGIALLLQPTPKFFENGIETEAEQKGGIKLLFGYLSLHKKLMLQLVLGLLTGSLISLTLPFLTQSIIDIGINTQNVQFIYLVLAGQFMLFFSRMAVDFIRRWILLHLSTRINISLISDFLVKLFKLPMPFFEGKMIGDILRRIEDHTRIEQFISTSSLSILFSFFNFIVFSIVLAIYHIPMFLVFAGFSACYIVFVLLFMKKRAALDYKRFQQMADNQSSLIQTVQGMSEIKMNNCETQKRWEWERIQAKLFHINVASTKLQQYQDAGSLFLNESKNMLITVMAAFAVIEGSITLGMMLAIQYIIGQLNAPIQEFIAFTRAYQDAKISLERINEIQHEKNEQDDSVHTGFTFNTTANASLILHKVSFQYEGPHSPKVLDDIDLVIQEGKITAIVGTSGSGKTTLMKLLLKFYKPTDGKINLDAENMENIRTAEWRKICGTVMQDGYIFSDTIARNISLADEEIDAKKLRHAVQIANIESFIEGLPLGYNTKIGSNGVGLSQGQKQRLLIARAVYKNPQYIFFDEATSALDANNEKTIMENLNQFFKDKTVLVIAHRLSTVKNADQIVVLEKGKIVEVGSHEELTTKKGFYYELVKNQLELGN
ncbi:ABC transporter ATP-binding protein [Chryseotalea sanaruensis]|uniref:ABC transporter ATP-binding protein n=1 Tax=Chryseotalea sanaruensis TaxID=2482724 RepID=A0A401U7N8_9BACT|nr:peptidase domain-containing ABC transporter [Chryseotalea sanaruensis]GCC50902.1 ABC transporter ATP-binding protein [Chryseotalea sanaruensis]